MFFSVQKLQLFLVETWDQYGRIDLHVKHPSFTLKFEGWRVFCRRSGIKFGHGSLESPGTIDNSIPVFLHVFFVRGFWCRDTFTNGVVWISLSHELELDTPG